MMETLMVQVKTYFNSGFSIVIAALILFSSCCFAQEDEENPCELFPEEDRALCEKAERHLERIGDRVESQSDKENVQRTQMKFMQGNSEQAVKDAKKKDYERHQRDAKRFGETKIIGLCSGPLPSSFYPYYKYRYPWEVVELRTAQYGGEYIITKTAKELRDIHLGKKEGFKEKPLNEDKKDQEARDIYKLAELQAPADINRARALTYGKDKDERKENFQNYKGGQKGFLAKEDEKTKQLKDIPDINPLHSVKINLEEQYKLRTTNRSAAATRLEAHIIPEINHMADRTLPPLGAPLMQCHDPHRIREEEKQRTDALPYTTLSMSKAYSDLRYRKEMEQLNFNPGSCIGFDVKQGLSLPVSVGEGDGSEDSKFGTIAALNPNINIKSLGGRRVCLPGAGAIYPMTSNIENSSSFKNAALNRFLKFQILRRDINKRGVHDFNMYGIPWIRPADYVKVVSPPLLAAKNPLPLPLWMLLESLKAGNLSNEVDPIDPNRIVLETYKYLRCCPILYFVIKADNPLQWLQVRGFDDRVPIY